MSELPQATHEGDLIVGDIAIPCAVLDDGRRVLTQSGFLAAIGRNERPKGGSGVLDENVAFLSASNLSPFVSEELIEAARPIVFQNPKGRGYGYEASLLPAVCDVYLDARRADALHYTQRHIAVRCEILVRGFARVGIIALIDEATGYQDIRARNNLEQILAKYLTDHKLKWAKRFPDEFYREIFRLRGWDYSEHGFQFRPAVVGKYTNDIVYERLAPGVLDELQKLNPTNEQGHRASKHHQWLTEDQGVPELKSHIAGVIALMRASPNWDRFMRLVDRAYPKPGDTLFLGLDDE
jgi:hypothetical protein